jgi:hypothetical protein
VKPQRTHPSGGPAEDGRSGCYDPNVNVPPLWPAIIPSPDTPGWERLAVAWLLSVVPPGYYEDADLFREYPEALVSLARHHTSACVIGARDGYRVARTELHGHIPPHRTNEVLAVWGAEGLRLREEDAGVELVARALAWARSRR